MAHQHFYRRMTQDNYSSNYKPPPSTVILKVGILIKTDADFYTGGVEKTKDTKMARRRAARLAESLRRAAAPRAERGRATRFDTRVLIKTGAVFAI